MKSLICKVFALGVVGLLLAGCGVTVQPTASTTGASSGGSSTANFSAAGRVMGGQQPIIGAQVYLYAVSTANGGTTTSLLKGTGYVVTLGDGSYSISPGNVADYTCPTGAYVYLLALGGSPGLANGVNSKIALAAGVGTCSSLTNSSKFALNEATTIAMAYSFANYATTETQIGTTSNLAVPFGNITTLIDPVQGAAKASNASTELPQAKLDSLADSIAACVNSPGSSSACATLMSAANVTGASGTPIDTFQAALNIAKNPTTNVSAIYGLGTASSPFMPTLSGAPADWSLVPVPVSGCIVADTNTYVLRSNQGDIAVELRPDVAPQNVAKMVSYINNGSYTNSIIHRVVAGFVNQGGGYYFNNGQLNAIQPGATVVNEFNLSNVRGTLAIANPNSATSQFFFNVANNSSLDAQSYTVVGQVVQVQGIYNNYGIGTCGNAGLAVMDAINADTTYDLSGTYGAAFAATPLINYTTGSTLQASNFVTFASVVPLTNTATTVATPVPTPGFGTYTGTQMVTLTDSTPGAVIYYAFQPGNGANLPPYAAYTGPIAVSQAGALYMYATAPAYANQSVVNYATYVIQ